MLENLRKKSCLKFIAGQLENCIKYTKAVQSWLCVLHQLARSVSKYLVKKHTIFISLCESVDAKHTFNFKRPNCISIGEILGISVWLAMRNHITCNKNQQPKAISHSGGTFAHRFNALRGQGGV